MATVEVDSQELISTIEQAMEQAYDKAQGATAASFSMIAMMLHMYDVPEHIIKSVIDAAKEMYTLVINGELPDVQ